MINLPYNLQYSTAISFQALNICIYFYSNFKPLSHYAERKEKDCLNCGTIVEGRFCQHCGQENVVQRDSFWGLLTHFVYDITHFDSKFFDSLKYLLFKPGFLSLEYMRGRRNSYLNPVKMYVFTSALFFVIFFSLYNVNSLIKSERMELTEKREAVEAGIRNIQADTAADLQPAFRQAAGKALVQLQQEKAKLDLRLAEYEKKDSTGAAVPSQIRDSLKTKGIRLGKKTTIDTDDAEDAISFSQDSLGTRSISGFNYRSVEAYRAIQQQLPKENRDGWIKQGFMSRLVATLEQEKKGSKAFLRAFLDNLLHTFPKMLFVSLPIFALLLQLLYIRKKLFYSDHAIFTIHLYIATFIFLLAIFGFIALEEATNWGILGFVIPLSILVVYFYQYKALRRFYGDSRRKTIFKFVLLNFLSFIMMVFLFTIFTMISATQLTGSGTH